MCPLRGGIIVAISNQDILEYFNGFIEVSGMLAVVTSFAPQVIQLRSRAEEGLDVPDVDMVVTWSITANPVRFIQRQGRGMRAGSGEHKHPKVNIFLATPDTPDYEALYRGIARAEAAGLEYS